MKQVKLIATDLDGTLLGEGNDVSQRNLAALTRATQAGISLVIATGRNYSEIPDRVLALPVRYFITANGGYVYDREKDQVICSRCLTLEQAVYVISIGKEFGGYSMFYINRNVYTSSNFSEYMAALPQRSVYEVLARRYIPCDDIAREPGADAYIQKVVLFFQKENKRRQALEAVQSRDCRAGEFEISSSYLSNVEINPRGVNKGVGLKEIMRIMNIAESEAAAIGDSGNDRKMLELVGHSYAVANAVPEIKACVGPDRILSSNVEHGVAYLIDRLLEE